MPWNESTKMDEKLKFVSRYLDGEKIANCGRICLDGKKIHFSTVFAGHDVGLRQVEEDVWLVSFMDYDMAYFDMESSRVQALENPFGPKVLGM